jgi:Ca2+-binding RTX toxin-like protein
MSAQRPSLRTVLGVAVTGLLTTGVALIGDPAAAAATGVASVYGDTKAEYRAATGKVNKVVVTQSGRTFTIDDVVTVKAGKGCKAVKGDVTKVRCTTKKTPNWFRVYTGNKNDTITNKTTVGMTVRAGSGNNTITGGPKHDELFADDGNDKVYALGGNDYVYTSGGNDLIYGGAGDNELIGGPGNDTIYGGPDFDRIRPDSGNDVAHGGDGGDYFEESAGKDVLYGDAGSDEFFQNEYMDRGTEDMRGGSGWDQVTYMSRTKAIYADPDGKKGDDGAKGEGDSIGTDVEGISGGLGNDYIGGNSGDNYLFGDEGNDKIVGYGGNDQLSGYNGNDRLEGGGGDDTLSGDFGTDVMLGGSGVDEANYYDRLVTVVADLDGLADDGSKNEKDTIGADVENLAGGWGADTLTGNAGKNVIYGGHGADVIHGGDGNDELDAGEGIKGGVDKVYGEAGDDTLRGGESTEYDRFVLDGGPNTETGDNCLPGTRGTGDLIDCERTDW